MKTAAELRAEADGCPEFAHSVNDTEVLKEVRAMIAELGAVRACSATATVVNADG